MRSLKEDRVNNVAKRRHRPLTEAETAYRGGYAEGRRFGGCQAMMERVQMFEPTAGHEGVIYPARIRCHR